MLDSRLCRVIQNLLSDRRFYVELNNERSRWRIQKNGLPQGSVLSLTLFNIYTNDQPILDDLCITTQYHTFQEVEQIIEEVLGELTHYYRSNSLRANRKSRRFICGTERLVSSDSRPARGGTAERKIFLLANWSHLIHPGPSSSRSSSFFYGIESVVRGNADSLLN